MCSRTISGWCEICGMREVDPKSMEIHRCLLVTPFNKRCNVEGAFAVEVMSARFNAWKVGTYFFGRRNSVNIYQNCMYFKVKLMSVIAWTSGLVEILVVLSVIKKYSVFLSIAEIHFMLTRDRHWLVLLLSQPPWFCYNVRWRFQIMKLFFMKFFLSPLLFTYFMRW